MNYIKTCSCEHCKQNKKKRKLFRQANRRFRRQGKPSNLMAKYREGKPIDIEKVSTGFIA